MGKIRLRLTGDYVEYKLLCSLKLVTEIVEDGSQVNIKDSWCLLVQLGQTSHSYMWTSSHSYVLKTSGPFLQSENHRTLFTRSEDIQSVCE